MKISFFASMHWPNDRKISWTQILLLFIDRFSGYFKILLPHADQEKTENNIQQVRCKIRLSTLNIRMPLDFSYKINSNNKKVVLYFGSMKNG